MAIRTVIPFKPVDSKTRLSPLMTQPEREAFARAMLEDVIQAILDLGSVPTIISTHPAFTWQNAEVIVTTAGLNDALNAYFHQVQGPLLIVMADLPLASPEALERVISIRADIGIVPGRGGGTNVLFIKDPSRFRADFYGASFLKHIRIADEYGCTIQVVDSFRLHTDIDEEEDLVEVFIHGEGTSKHFLDSLGFSLVIEQGRVGISRNTHE